MPERFLKANTQRINCRRLAVLSDIHSNYHAFRTCYEDALLRGADGFVFLGDYISDLADPVKTLDLVYEIREKYPTVCLRGNRERYMLDHESGAAAFSRGSKSGSLLYTYEQLRPLDFAFIKSVPIYDTVKINGVVFEIAHAVKENDRYYFEKGDDAIPNVFSEMKYGYLLTGHSHKQYMKSSCGKTIINPGSVGVPQGGDIRSQYALLEIEAGNVQCVLCRVSYSLEAAIRAQFESGLVDYAKYWAISILYDIITGREYTVKLLERVARTAEETGTSIHDEALWHTIAVEMGMKFSEKEIQTFSAEGDLPVSQ